MSAAKTEIRKEILRRRSELSAGEVSQRSRQIFTHIQNELLPLIETASSIGLYFPIRGEVETRDLFAFCRKRKKTVVLPKVEGDQLRFYSVSDFSELITGAFGVAEPRGGTEVSPSLLFVPGVAFSRATLSRVGYGKGFYDRYLAGHSRPRLIGLAYDFQILASFASDSHDIPMDQIVTEHEVLTKVSD